MNAVERLEAAITKLETLKAEATPGPWDMDPESYWTDPPADSEFGPIQIERPEDGRLILALHRTIDAQLAILRTAVEDYRVYARQPSKHLPSDVVIVALADAILGGDQ